MPAIIAAAMAPEIASAKAASQNQADNLEADERLHRRWASSLRGCRRLTVVLAVAGKSQRERGSSRVTSADSISREVAMGRRIVSGVVGGMAALFLAACGGSQPGISQGSSGTATPTPRAPAVNDQLKVLKVGFGQDPDRINTMAVVVLANPSPTDAALLVTVQTSAYDAAGKVVGTGSSGLTFMRAAEKTAVATPIQVAQGASVSEIKAQVSATQWEKDPHPKSTISTSDVKFDPGQYGLSQVIGQVQSHFTTNLKTLATNAVCYDASGAVIGGGSSILDLLPGGGSVGASVTVFVRGQPANCDLYVDLTAASGTNS